MEDDTYYEGYEDGRNKGRKDAIDEIKRMLVASPQAVRTYRSALRRAIKKIEKINEPTDAPAELTFDQKTRLIQIIKNL